MKEQRARVFNNGVLAGYLSKVKGEYLFTYDKEYVQNSDEPPISLTLPKTEVTYKSKTLFPFFFGLLAEGENKKIQCRVLKIDENDHFTRLVKTANSETIGAITVHEDTESI